MGSGGVLKTVFVGNRPTARHLRKGRIVVADGPQSGQTVVLERQRLRIGRSAVCDLTLDDSSVSGVHVELLATEDGLILKDAGSTNGTWAGEVRVLEAKLTPGAHVRVGNTTLRYEALDDVVEIPLATEDRFAGVIGTSVPMREIFATLDKVAGSDLTVLLEGETGTGKEVFARAIHERSRRKGKPFVVLDCSAIAKNLSESTLFGHEQGSFTGATGRHRGAFEQADGGTVFLDEIGELPIDLQPKLLRVLETQVVKRVGGTKPFKVDVRLVAATNRDLRKMVADGGFREDLFFRLSVIHLELPPLRDRVEDIPLLARHFLGKLDNPRFPGQRGRLMPDAVEALQRHPWPGNVRELRNVVERAISLADGPELHEADLFLTGGGGPLALPSVTTPAMPAVGGGGSAAGKPIDLGQPFKEAKQEIVEEWEARYLDALMAEHKGNISASSRAAGLTRYHLRELLKKYGLAGRDAD